MRFAIFTHVDHQEQAGQYLAYAPYVREMNLWFKILNSDLGIRTPEWEVEVVAPLSGKITTSRGMAYKGAAINFTSIPSFDLLTFWGILTSIIKIPFICLRMVQAMYRADHLHLRCPGNIGLLACMVQVFFPGKPKTAKYAGNWDPRAKQPWSYRLQRWILQNTFLTRNMTVLVYGDWPNSTRNIQSFFTASFSEKTILKTQDKTFKAPFLLLFAGNLVPGKGLKLALKTMKALQKNGVACGMEIYGEGPEKAAAERYVEAAGIRNVVFKGNRSLEELEEGYDRAHFVILPSKSEGWPKVVAEGMFFGCIPIATSVSCVPWMLGSGSRGILLDINYELGIQNSELERIIQLLQNPREMERMSKAASEWSQEYTLERFEEGIRGVLS